MSLPTSVINLSCGMQQLAHALHEVLNETAGKKVDFILLAHVDGVMQYVSTIEREQSIEIIEELLERWKANKADIPAHYNPNLKI